MPLSQPDRPLGSSRVRLFGETIYDTRTQTTLCLRPGDFAEIYSSRRCANDVRMLIGGIWKMVHYDELLAITGRNPFQSRSQGVVPRFILEHEPDLLHFP